MQFDFNTEKDTFFDIRDMLKRNTGQLPVYEMPPVFNSIKFSRSQRTVSTLKCFLESSLTLEKYPDNLVEIEIFLYRWEE